MSDLISRQAAIDAVADYLSKTTYTSAISHLNTAALILARVPSAQPEIIRCKDCRWYEGDIMANPWGICCNAGWVGGHCGHEVSEDGWCYRAEVEE